MSILQPILAKATRIHVFRSISQQNVSFSSLNRVCIVGSGPAGFYTAKYLLKEHPKVHVDMIENLPTPFGLVRSGVAPDHPEVKSVINDFEKVAEDDRFQFIGNIMLDKDISIKQLQPYYNAVVLAYGAADDRKLNIPGEDLKNVYSARSFVNWYNGHPDFVNLNPDLSDDTAVVIGQGNVAIDCARILSKSKQELCCTDISQQALDQLERSKIKRVIIVGRRGHAQAAFTMKELREVTKLDHAQCIIRNDELDLGRTNSSNEEIRSHRARKRMDELLSKSATSVQTNLSTKSLEIRFLLSPTEILPDPACPSRVGALRVERTTLVGPPNKQKAVGTGEFETISCGLILKSIGYKSQPTVDVPFDSDLAIIPNRAGRITECGQSEPIPGLYCAGWLKRGPSGIIGTNITDAKETVTSILEDAENNQMLPIKKDGGFDALRQELKERTKKKIISWKEYLRIDDHEKRLGEKVGKPREKLTSISEMLNVATQ